MLKRIGSITAEPDACVRIAEALWPAPFISGLEFSPPARGVWNIVHTGMLIPESRQIFVCAENCLRGVVLTAAEMNAMDRFSTVSIEENNVLDGDMEELIIDGVSAVLERVPVKPRAVLVYTSCIHHFMGCDLTFCFGELRRRFPAVDFTDCYMNPIMRKSGLTPDQIMRKQLYSLLRKRPVQEMEQKSVNIIGNNIPTDENSDIVQLIRNAGWSLRDVTYCRTYEDYQEMACSAFNISYNPVAAAAGMELEQRLGQKHLYLPLCYGREEIRRNMQKLAETLGTEYDGGLMSFEKAEAALAAALRVIGSTPVAIDYTATMRPLGLARLLLEHGFNVFRVYIDSFNAEEKADFEWLRLNRPELPVFATAEVKMRVLPRTAEQKILAVGQKAAYFTGSNNFVNIVEGGGMYGFSGIEGIAEMMTDAFINEKDARRLIQQKGLGCECCL